MFLSFKDYVLLGEGLDTPYRWKNTFSTTTLTDDWDDIGEEYPMDRLDPVQIIHFQTQTGIPYIWYAKQSRYAPTSWEIAFGIVKKKDDDGRYATDIGITKTGNAFRVFATVIDITNAFIDFDDDYYQVRELIINSTGAGRTRLYKNYLADKISHFSLSSIRKIDDEETQIVLARDF
jgi:hypothetical protein